MNSLWCFAKEEDLLILNVPLRKSLEILSISEKEFLI
jgi:hypothetical protein